LYRGTRDGFRNSEFPLNCPKYFPTLTVYKVKNTGYIYGGYTESLDYWSTKSDKNEFVFSLTNRENAPIKMKSRGKSKSIYCGPSYGPKVQSFKDTDNSYKFYTQYFQGNYEENKFFYGSDEIQLDEIEVYQRFSLELKIYIFLAYYTIYCAIFVIIYLIFGYNVSAKTCTFCYVCLSFYTNVYKQ